MKLIANFCSHAIRKLHIILSAIILLLLIKFIYISQTNTFFSHGFKYS